MVAVAVVAAAIGITRERSHRFQRLAIDYGRRATRLGLGFPTPHKERRYPTITQFGRLLDDGPEALRLERQYWWLQEMSARYEDAARSPWLPVGPDPPPP